MARIYQSRNLLDPSLLSIAEQKKQQYIQNNRDYLNKQTEAINTALKGVGQAATDWYGRSSRRNMLEDSFNNSLRDKLEIPEGTSPEEVARMEKINAWVDKKNDSLTRSWNDPDYIAAREKFIQTGDPSSMNAYKQNVLMQQARAQDAFRKAEEAKKAAAWHENVQFGTDQANVAKLTSQMYEALDKGNLASAEAIQQQIKSYEDKWAPKNRNFGNTAEAMLKARQEEIQTKADEEMGAKNLKTLQEADEADRKYRAELFINEKIPKLFGKETDKNAVYADIQGAVESGLLKPEEATKLMQEVRNAESGEVAKKKARANAVAGAAGEQTKKNIQDTQDKNEAQGYVGQKMNSLQFMQLPENVRKHLTRNGQGIISMK